MCSKQIDDTMWAPDCISTEGESNKTTIGVSNHTYENDTTNSFMQQHYSGFTACIERCTVASETRQANMALDPSPLAEFIIHHSAPQCRRCISSTNASFRKKSAASSHQRRECRTALRTQTFRHHLPPPCTRLKHSVPTAT